MCKVNVYLCLVNLSCYTLILHIPCNIYTANLKLVYIQWTHSVSAITTLYISDNMYMHMGNRPTTITRDKFIQNLKPFVHLYPRYMTLSTIFRYKHHVYYSFCYTPVNIYVLLGEPPYVSAYSFKHICTIWNSWHFDKIR